MDSDEITEFNNLKVTNRNEPILNKTNEIPLRGTCLALQLLFSISYLEIGIGN